GGPPGAPSDETRQNDFENTDLSSSVSSRKASRRVWTTNNFRVSEYSLGTLVARGQGRTVGRRRFVYSGQYTGREGPLGPRRHWQGLRLAPCAFASGTRRPALSKVGLAPPSPVAPGRQHPQPVLGRLGERGVPLAKAQGVSLASALS